MTLFSPPHLDPVCRFVADHAVKMLRARRVLLFGSRARGTARERSDYDFAIDASDASHAEWARFAVTVSDEAPSLLHIDLIHLQSDLDDALRARILKEGIEIQ